MKRRQTAQRIVLYALTLPALASDPAPAQSRPAPPTTPRPAPLPKGFIEKDLTLPDGSNRKCVIFLPAQYDLDDTHRWPVIVFLHGSGECGTDGRRHLAVGLPKYIAARPTRFPFITVMPQAKTLWYRGDDAAAVWAALDQVHRDYRTDRDRVLMTGLSMGGFATWELSMARPDVLAAIVPVCGIGPTEYASNIAHLPVWAFHGAKDDRVPVAGTRRMIEALKALGAEPKYTEFPNTRHNSWDRAYADRGLYRWLLKQRRRKPPRVIDYKFPGGKARVWWLTVEAESDRPQATPASIRAEIGGDGRVRIDTKGVKAWALVSTGPPVEPGDEIDVTWNNKPVYKGKFTGILVTRPQAPSPQPTTNPSEPRP